MAVQPGMEQFELARQRAKRDVNASVQGQQDALKRKFAAMNAGNSGAAIKAGQMVAEKGLEAQNQAVEGINAQENAELARRGEVEAGREFQRAEREAGQGFMGQQAALGREFAKGEREAGQAYASGEAAAQRAFMTGERVAGQTFTAQQAKLARDLQSSQFNKQMSQAKKQFEKQFKEEQFVNRENIKIAQATLGQQDLLEKMLNPGGGSFYSFGNLAPLAGGAMPGSPVNIASKVGSIF